MALVLVFSRLHCGSPSAIPAGLPKQLLDTGQASVRAERSYTYTTKYYCFCTVTRPYSLCRVKINSFTIIMVIVVM